MPTKQAKSDATTSSRGRGSNPFRAVRRTLTTLMVFAILIYIVGLVVGRTDGFRSIVAQRLEKIIGMPVKIDRVRLAPNYALTLTEVAAESGQRGGAPGVRARQVDIEWRWRDLWRHGRLGIARLQIDKPAVAFAESADGTWEPARLAPAGEFLLRQLNVTLPAKKATGTSAPSPTPAEKPSVPPEKAALVASVIGLDADVSFKRGEVVWWAQGNDAPMASIEGASLSVSPLHLPGREMTHYLLNVDRAASANGPGMSGLVAEFLDLGDQQIVLRFLAEHTPNSPTDRAQP